MLEGKMANLSGDLERAKVHSAIGKTLLRTVSAAFFPDKKTLHNYFFAY